MLMEQPTFVEWNYESKTTKSTGYEECGLENYLVEDFKLLNEEEQDKFIDTVFDIYRSKNIYPIWYFNEIGIEHEIRKCLHKKVEFEDDGTLPRALEGQDLCRFMMPNLTQVRGSAGRSGTMWKRFYDDKLLKKTIRLVCDMHEDGEISPTAIRSKAELIGGQVATNFHPMKAKTLYEKYCPANGTIYDFACGFGGRLLGALTSKQNYKYIGVEPCVETNANLKKFGAYIEKATRTKDRFEIICSGSEDYCGGANSVDFAFSSPPYFNLEKYSDEDTQCYNKFPTLEEWFEGYVKPTIENIYTMLKPGRYYAVNIADFSVGKNDVAYVDKWVELSKEAGFDYVEEIPMSLQSRRGYGHADNSVKKVEGIFVFKKPAVNKDDDFIAMAPNKAAVEEVLW